MRERDVKYGRCRCAVPTLLLTLAALSPHAGAASTPDSIAVDWGVLFSARIDVTRDDAVFPWNDPEARSHRRDRLVSMLAVQPLCAFDLFLKGSSGYRGEREGVRRNRFALAQGHLGFDPPWRWMEGMLFLRERRFRTHHELLPLVSNDAPFLDGRGQGVRLDIGDTSRRIRIRYLDAILRTEDLSVHGGLPTFRGGGDVFRMLCGSFAVGDRARIGFTASEARSIASGDGVMIGSDIDIAVGGVRLIAELARTVRGRWSDLRDASLLGLDPRKARLGSFSEIFSPGAAFSTEVHGLETASERWGDFLAVPGYRFYGRRFFAPHGEITGGLVESSLVTWWRHPHVDAGGGIEACERYDGATGERYGLMRGSARARVRGGFDVTGNALFVEGRRPTMILSIIDEHDRARIRTTVRLDDAGGGNALTFLAEGQMNLGASWSLRNTLYLYRSLKSHYTVELEFRPGRRFLLRAAVGSFRSFEEDIMMHRALDPAPPSGERWLSIYTRVWFGRI